jgi:cytochrome c oxidase subunit I
LGMPRRMAYYDYSNPALAPDAWTVIASAIGGALLVISGVLVVYVLVSAFFRQQVPSEPYRFATALHERPVVPRALNGFAVWVGLMIALTLVNYGFPIWQLHKVKITSVPATYVGDRQ